MDRSSLDFESWWPLRVIQCAIGTRRAVRVRDRFCTLLEKAGHRWYDLNSWPHSGLCGECGQLFRLHHICPVLSRSVQNLKTRENEVQPTAIGARVATASSKIQMIPYPYYVRSSKPSPSTIYHGQDSAWGSHASSY